MGVGWGLIVCGCECEYKCVGVGVLHVTRVWLIC